MLLADINLSDVLWSMLVFFFFVIFLWMVFGIIADIFRSDDLSGVTKAIWCIALVFLPFLTIFVYLIVRGKSMSERAIKANADAQQQMDAYIRQTAGSGGATAEIANAKALLDSGAISQAEFDQLKAKALASS